MERLRRTGVLELRLIVTSGYLMLLLAHAAEAQLILNEANAVGADQFVDVDPEKPYEGFDFGIVTYSGNDNSETNPSDPGNPFPLDVNDNPSITQTTLPNGWDRSQPTGWARIEGNGGDWMELVVTQDHTDLRGYTLFFQNDEDFDFQIGENPDERGFIKFLNNKDFADLRAGTIITISEDASVNEIRDQYSANPNYALFPPHDTGFDYDLSSDPTFDPFQGDDWHVHFHVDESRTDNGLDTEYFAAFSDAKVDNDEWTLWIFDSTNTAAQAESEDPSVVTVSDLTTGLVQGPIGESQDDWGANTGGGNVNNQELLSMNADPSDAATSADFEDVDFSTFGRPNMYNDATEDTLDGVQDFSALRDPVLSGTHDWAAAGTSDFGAAGNWINARSGATPASGPAATWTGRLANDAGGAKIAQVTSNTSVSFINVMASSGTMKLEVQAGTTLTVTGGDQPGRVLAMAGGLVQVDGTIDAQVVEGFAGAVISGTGSITGDLANSGGIVQPGSGAGGVLSVGGDFVQDAEGTLLVDLTGSSSGAFGSLAVAGTATVDGLLEIALGGFTPLNGASFTVLSSAGLTDLGITLTGDVNGFSLSVVNNMDLVLSYTGSSLSPDFDNDGLLGCSDIDLLTAAVANMGNDPAFDLTGDGSVNLADRDAWLALAGAANLDSQNPYLVGDANLDGSVDTSDFNIWNSNKFTGTAAWCSGDFSADGSVDTSDFNLWNSNKFRSSADGAMVPEPSSALYLLGMLATIPIFRPKRPTR